MEAGGTDAADASVFDVLCSMSAFGTLADVHDAWPAWS